MRRFFVTDIHGSAKGFIECLIKAKFDYQNDLLICGGDTCDGWSGVKEAFDILLEVKILIYILGNHDSWYIQFYEEKMKMYDFRSWTTHGGNATVKSLGKDKKVYDLLKSAKRYFRLDDKLFTHAGFDYTERLEEQNDYYLMWDRQYVELAYKHKDEPNLLLYNYADPEIAKHTIYLGHTPTSYLEEGNIKPMKFNNVILCDTSSAFNGCVTLYNIDTDEYYQSTESMKLYPDELGRNKITYNNLIK